MEKQRNKIGFIFKIERKKEITPKKQNVGPKKSVKFKTELINEKKGVINSNNN